MLKKSASLPSASVWFVWFIWLILFNETNQRNQMDQTDQITRQTGPVPDVLTIDVLALFAALATYFAWEIGRRGLAMREVSPLVKFIALGMAGAISFLVKAHAPLQPTTKYAVMGLWCVLLALAAGWLFAADFAKRAEGSLSWRLVVARRGADLHLGRRDCALWPGTSGRRRGAEGCVRVLGRAHPRHRRAGGCLGRQSRARALGREETQRQEGVMGGVSVLLS